MDTLIRTCRRVSALLILFACSIPGANAVVIAFDMVNSTSQNLIAHTNAFENAFSSAGDGFQKYQRGVSPSIPFGVLDDSLVTFPPDSQGVIAENNRNQFFGVVDTLNVDNPSGNATASWSFDVSGYRDLRFSINAGAMGDFESTDGFSWEYSIDGGPVTPFLSSSVDESVSQVYNLAGGGSFTLDDPMVVDGTVLTNQLQTFSSGLVGSGSVLEIRLNANTNGGNEAFAFQDLVIEGTSSLLNLVINEIMQNPSAVSDFDGEWFELFNPNASAVDINGWTIRDNDIDSHVINNGGPLLVPAGGYVVLGRNSDMAANGGVLVDYEYTGISLANGADELVLLDDLLQGIDLVAWDGGPAFPDPNGASMSLRDPLLDNNVGANWVEGTSPFGAGDLGTPRAANLPSAVPEPSAIILFSLALAGISYRRYSSSFTSGTP